MEDCTEIVDFGPNCGNVNVSQLAGDAFHKACLQINSFNADNTGLRMHVGLTLQYVFFCYILI